MIRRHDDDQGNAIPSHGWGWTIGPSIGANGAGYSVVNIPDGHKEWPGTYPEQICMHEWTHQTVGFFSRLGHPMPDIHAPASYGYLSEQ